eukprot:TRINITY_DN3817_c0_g1_i7.p1 TRINITY_DN3817_c0_g1~~TRINITY_DN3817_c0_g1_i7.p1  ORF type:complete len:542 (+),score=24.81 TRINITY_DN3817_c0_g1_i7:1683-3308(+)
MQGLPCFSISALLLLVSDHCRAKKKKEEKTFTKQKMAGHDADGPSAHLIKVAVVGFGAYPFERAKEVATEYQEYDVILSSENTLTLKGYSARGRKDREEFFKENKRAVFYPGVHLETEAKAAGDDNSPKTNSRNGDAAAGDDNSPKTNSRNGDAVILMPEAWKGVCEQKGAEGIADVTRVRCREFEFIAVHGMYKDKVGTSHGEDKDKDGTSHGEDKDKVGTLQCQNFLDWLKNEVDNPYVIVGGDFNCANIEAMARKAGFSFIAIEKPEVDDKAKKEKDIELGKVKEKVGKIEKKIQDLELERKEKKSDLVAQENEKYDNLVKKKNESDRILGNRSNGKGSVALLEKQQKKNTELKTAIESHALQLEEKKKEHESKVDKEIEKLVSGKKKLSQKYHELEMTELKPKEKIGKMVFIYKVPDNVFVEVAETQRTEHKNMVVAIGTNKKECENACHRHRILPDCIIDKVRDLRCDGYSIEDIMARLERNNDNCTASPVPSGSPVQDTPGYSSPSPSPIHRTATSEDTPDCTHTSLDYDAPLTK